MREFEDTNTADIRYVIGIPLLVAVMTFVPMIRIFNKPADMPLVAFIGPAVATSTTFFFIYMFSKMSTSITDGKIRIVWIFGFPKKEIQISEILSVELQEITNWWGYGVKKGRGGSMWRAWGKTVVVVEKHDGKRVLIGSDNPHELHQAIRSAVGDYS